jgi:hypothetical protein
MLTIGSCRSKTMGISVVLCGGDRSSSTQPKVLAGSGLVCECADGTCLGRVRSSSEARERGGDGRNRGWGKVRQSGSQAHPFRQALKQQALKQADKRLWHTSSGTQSKHIAISPYHHITIIIIWADRERHMTEAELGRVVLAAVGGVFLASRGPKWCVPQRRWRGWDASELKASCHDAPLRHAHHPIRRPGRPWATMGA